MPVTIPPTISDSLLSDNPCIQCLSKSQLDQLKLAIMARGAGLNIGDDLDTILNNSACYNCLSELQMAQIETIILWQNLANGVSFETLIEEIKCLNCTDPKRIRAATLSLLNEAMNPVVT